MLGRALLVFFASTVFLACPKTKSDTPPTTCSKIGDACTFAPGKLGLCIAPADGGAALVCQSQH